MQLDAEDIESFFRTYGWQFDRPGEGHFRTGFVGESGQYEIWVNLSEDWVYFAISPYVERPVVDGVAQVVHRLMLRANHDLNLAKFALDQDGDVVLMVELPREGFAYSHFADSLTALSHYADQWRPAFDAVVASTATEGGQDE
ncbi:MAG: YbjN domain-containing protein [Myxococcota bacterium]